MNKFTAKSVLKNQPYAEKRATVKNTRRSQRKMVRQQLREIEKMSIEQMDDTNVYTRQERRFKNGEVSWYIFDSFLNSRIGRPWDEIYSEFCGEVDRRTYAAHQIKEMLRARIRISDPKPDSISDEWFYFVDDEGILRKNAFYYNNTGHQMHNYWKGKKTVDELCMKVGSGPAGPRYSGDTMWRYYSFSFYQRKIIKHGTKLYWAYRQKSYAQGEELSEYSAALFNSLSPACQRMALYVPGES